MISVQTLVIWGCLAVACVSGHRKPFSPIPLGLRPLLDAEEFHKLPNNGEIKVVLIAGSNGYDNYRHQADICHAYQVLHENGIPDENIIVMMYDDIAENSENPDHGVIINVPGGPNVYEGVPKDYTGKDVNKKNFFNVLRGNKTAMEGIGSGRVLESGPQDHVFVNFVDHGGPGVLLLPDEEITAPELISLLEDIAHKSGFAKMFWYIEACESGSMFDNLLPDDLNVFVMTAADPHESSYACFFDEQKQTYLADVFSVKWMENAETVDLREESVNHQFQKVRTETNTSHVEEYGDLDIGVTKLSQVIGYKREPSNAIPLQINDAVPSHHVPVAIVGQKLRLAKTQKQKVQLRKRLHELLQGRKIIEQVFLKLVSYVSPLNSGSTFRNLLRNRPALTRQNAECFHRLISHLTKECFSLSRNPYAASHLHKVINLCDTFPVDSLLDRITSVCSAVGTLKGIV